jgi:hypothetical protein
VLKVEFLIDDGRGVDLDALEGELLLGFCEELGFICRLGKVPVCEEGEADCKAAFDDEQVPPAVELGLNLKYTEGQQPRKGVGDVGRSVEEGQAARELATPIKGCEIVNNEGKAIGQLCSDESLMSDLQRGLCHSQKPSECHHATPVLHRCCEKRRAAKAEHHDRQDAVRTILLTQHANRRRKDNVWNIKYLTLNQLCTVKDLKSYSPTT